MGLAWSVKGDGGAILARLVKNLRSANLHVELEAWHACRPCLALYEPFGVDEVAFVALYNSSLAHHMLPVLGSMHWAEFYSVFTCLGNLLKSHPLDGVWYLGEAEKPVSDWSLVKSQDVCY